MTLRPTFDRLVAHFTDELLAVIGRMPLEELRALGGRRAVERKKPIARPVSSRPTKSVIAPPARPAPARPNSEATARQVPAPTPLSSKALERALLAVMRGAPKSREDVLEAASIGAEDAANANAALSSLVARGLVGEANLSGAPLFFAKRPERARRAPRAADLGSSAAAPLVPAAEWRPTVIRRKKSPALTESGAKADVPGSAE